MESFSELGAKGGSAALVWAALGTNWCSVEALVTRTFVTCSRMHCAHSKASILPAQGPGQGVAEGGGKGQGSHLTSG